MVLAQKEHKSLRQDTFHQLKIYLNCDWGRGSASNPTGELTALPQLYLRDPLRNREKGHSGQGGREGEERGGEEKYGETGKRWRGRRR